MDKSKTRGCSVQYVSLYVWMHEYFARRHDVERTPCGKRCLESRREAFSFMTEVAIHAEKQNHHPEWSNVWNTVNFELCTHDAGNIVTEKDEKLAGTISKIYSKYQSN